MQNTTIEAAIGILFGCNVILSPWAPLQLCKSACILWGVTHKTWSSGHDDKAFCCLALGLQTPSHWPQAFYRNCSSRLGRPHPMPGEGQSRGVSRWCNPSADAQPRTTSLAAGDTGQNGTLLFQPLPLESPWLPPVPATIPLPAVVPLIIASMPVSSIMVPMPAMPHANIGINHPEHAKQSVKEEGLSNLLRVKQRLSIWRRLKQQHGLSTSIIM